MKGKGKIKFYHSIVFLAITVVFLTSTILVGAIVLATIPAIKSETSTVVEEYMTDLVEAIGETIDYEVHTEGMSVIDNYDVMTKLLGEVKVSHYESSYAYLLNSEGLILWYPVKDYIGYTISNEGVDSIINLVTSGTSKCGWTEYSLDGVEKCTSYYGGAYGDYILFVSTDKADTTAIADSVQGTIIVLGIIFVVLMTSFSVLLLLVIFKSIGKIGNLISSMSDYDIADKADYDALSGKKNEIGPIAKATNLLQKSLVSMVGETAAIAKTVRTESLDTKKNIENASENVTGISNAMDELQQER